MGEQELRLRPIGRVVKGRSESGEDDGWQKAAAELESRIIELARDRFGDVEGMAEMFIGTMHGYCLNLLIRNIVRSRLCCFARAAKFYLLAPQLRATPNLWEAAWTSFDYGQRLAPFVRVESCRATT